MENEFYKDEFEQLLKEKADQFSMYPSRRVWHSIYNNLHPGRKWPSVAISLLLIGSLSFIGYLNTGDNFITRPINNNSIINTHQINDVQHISNNAQVSSNSKEKLHPTHYYERIFNDDITGETDFNNSYTVVQSNRPVYQNSPAIIPDVKPTAEATNNNAHDIVQEIDSYINSNKIFADIAINNKKNKNNFPSSPAENASAGNHGENYPTDINQMLFNKNKSPLISGNKGKPDENKETEPALKIPASANAINSKRSLTNEEKAWIENYALQNKPAGNKWKGRLAYQIYVTPAVNYRKLTSDTKGFVTPYVDGDINNSISQKPGVGIEAGIGLNYAIAKKLQLKGGLQFNYTNYNIAADKTNHPVMTTILLNDPSTGLSYSAARTSITANAYNSSPLQPVTLHNRTYQISLPLGFAYNLSSQKNVDWFAGATVQPSYIFGGNANLISSDLKSYVSEPSSIRSWNLNLGFETYMNFKMGSYNLQVGPQVRYQVYSTYKKEVALVEKPYAIGLKFGLTKGF
jgi:hypothetical protein